MNNQANFWNERFEKEGFMYGESPNTFIKNNAHHIPPKSNVLCLAEGEGRNAVYLAKEGFNVTALDASQIGLAKCAQSAAQANVAVSLECTNLTQWEPKETYLGIVASFMHLPEPLRQQTFSTALSCLAPKGVMIMEFFSKDQMLQGYTSGGPKDLGLLYSVEMLTPLFEANKDVEIVQLTQEEDHLNEGWGHQGKASLIRLIIQKKG